VVGAAGLQADRHCVSAQKQATRNVLRKNYFAVFCSAPKRAFVSDKECENLAGTGQIVWPRPEQIGGVVAIASDGAVKLCVRSATDAASLVAFWGCSPM
jgi:hypothetical protein